MRSTVTLLVVSAGVVGAPSVSGQAMDLTDAVGQIAEQLSAAAQAVQGQVADVDAATDPVTLYVLFPEDTVLQSGQALRIVAKGEPIMVNGEVVGFRETPVCEVEVTHRQDKLHVAKLTGTEPGQQPVAGNIAYTKSVPPSLALCGFRRTSDKADTVMGRELTDKLGTALQTTGAFTIVEREAFAQVLMELKLGLNDLFDPTKLAQLGKQTQAKGIVLGTITQQNAAYTINARVVDIETGIQVAAVAVNCGRSDEVDVKHDQVLGGGSGEGQGDGVKPPKAGPQTVKLFDALDPFQKSENWTSRALGKCPIGGKLFDGCVGYRMARPDRIHGVPSGFQGGGSPKRDEGFAIFDLTDGEYCELRAKVGPHDTDANYSDGRLVITCDGQAVLDKSFYIRQQGDRGARPGGFATRSSAAPEKKAIDVSIPLKDVGMLRIDITGGFLVAGDFQLVK